jgi:hypothetical protein
MKINNDANGSALAAALIAERKPASKHTRKVREFDQQELDQQGLTNRGVSPQSGAFRLGRVEARYLQN